MQLDALNAMFNNLSISSFTYDPKANQNSSYLPSEDASRLLAQHVLDLVRDNWLTAAQINEITIPVTDGIVSFNANLTTQGEVTRCANGISSSCENAVNYLMAAITTTPR